MAAGQFTREAIAVVKNRQFIEFCDRAGDRVTATLYRDVIEPDERFHHQLGRTLLLRVGDDGGGPGAGAPGGGPHARPGGGAPDGGAQDRGHPPRPRLLMDVDPAAREFAAAVSRPDGQIELARAALIIAKSEYPDPRRRGLSRPARCARRRARTSRAIGDPLGQLHRLRECLFEEEGFSGNSEDYADPRNSYLNDVLDRRLGIPITLSLVLIEVGRRLGLEMEGIGLPGHFITGARVDGEQVLLDPFNRGAILTAEGCREVVARALGQPVELGPEHFAPVTNRQFLARMLRTSR